ncbi:chloride channel protein [Haloechinothrix sp. YIM 98757]|uniref:Chloride channel protein n=1 Tax=Haloechinothrix aidingensis TaxID=2752311 RepID=A0A838A816_9PSEU|nr:chloride channel protein [Haloechinothrix aidingensis]
MTLAPAARRAGTLLALTLLIGALAGLAGTAFLWLTTIFTTGLTGKADYGTAGHASHPLLPGLGPWFLLAVPVLAGLLYGPLIPLLAPNSAGRGVSGQGISEVMHSVDTRTSAMSVRETAVKVFASTLCIAGGGSVGSVGPVAHLGSALGAALCRITRQPWSNLRPLLAGGAAGGLAGVLGAPIAAPVFALELVLRRFSVVALAVSALAGVTANAVARAIGGDVALFGPPGPVSQGPVDYLLFALVGIVVGAAGVLFVRVLYLVEDACDWVWRWPQWLRPAAGGLLLGALLLAVPELYGVGDLVMGTVLDGRYALGFLAVLLLGKILATSLSFGIGGYGGVFGPMLFIGAAGGVAVAEATAMTLPQLTTSPWLYGLIGMGAALAAAARAPATAIVLATELAGDPAVLLPAGTAVLAATLTGRALSKETIFTLDLRRQGLRPDGTRPTG